MMLSILEAHICIDIEMMVRGPLSEQVLLWGTGQMPGWPNV